MNILPSPATRALLGSVLLTSLFGCGSVTEEAPYGFNILRSGVSGDDFEAFVELSVRESERFRRQFLASSAAAVAEATVEFREKASAKLGGGESIAAFQLEASSLVDAVRGSQALDGAEIFGPFSGRWYGLWERDLVDHHWGPVTVFNPPRRVELGPDEAPVWVRSLQYAWIGDGYGLNIIATSRPADAAADFVLGYVIHVRDRDLSDEVARRPHVGVFSGPDQIIWITAKEVFLEERHDAGTDDERYAITGFSYRDERGSIALERGFQAVYTRDPEERPEFHVFAP